jgi:hypothetical protein
MRRRRGRRSLWHVCHVEVAKRGYVRTAFWECPCLATKLCQCDGTRPQCTRCSRLNLQCHYDVAEGVTRSDRMKYLRRENMAGRVDDMERVIQALRTGSDHEASTILARLRLGDSVDDMAKYLPASVSSSGGSGFPRYDSSFQTRYEHWTDVDSVSAWKRRVRALSTAIQTTSPHLRSTIAFTLHTDITHSLLSRHQSNSPHRPGPAPSHLSHQRNVPLRRESKPLSQKPLRTLHSSSFCSTETTIYNPPAVIKTRWNLKKI